MACKKCNIGNCTGEKSKDAVIYYQHMMELHILPKQVCNKKDLFYYVSCSTLLSKATETRTWTTKMDVTVI
jgi:hypothetical protein